MNKQAKMQVLHVININGFGGAEKLLLQLLPALNESVEVTCLVFYHYNTPDAAEVISTSLAASGVTTVTFPYNRIYQPGILKRIRGVVTEGNFDLVHTHLKHADFWLAILKQTRRVRVPVISTMHGYNDEYENQNGFRITKAIYQSPYYYLSKWINRQLDGFILISKIVSRFLNETKVLTAKKQAIIYHGYRGAELHDLPHPAQLSVAIPGRLLKRKGHRFVIEAMRHLTSSYPDLRLDIYGSGPELEALQELTAELKLERNVVFHGYVEEVPQKLTAADVVVIPSLWEGFGLVFLDAFHAGVPVIAFDLPAANEIISDGETGLLAMPFSSESIVEKIKMLLADPLLGARLAANAKTDLSIRFDMGLMVHQYVQFYKEVTNNG